MENFANPREAKEYLIAQLVAEADREGVVLSETERTMLFDRGNQATSIHYSHQLYTRRSL